MGVQVLEGEITVQRDQDGGVTVLEAPPKARMSLEFLRASDWFLVTVRGREVTFAGQVMYRVVGWDDIQSALLLERVGEGI